MAWRKARTVIAQAYNDVLTNHTMAMAAGLSYYFVMSLFPLLILAAAIVAYLPIPHLFDRILDALQHVMPPNSMGLVRSVVHGVLTKNRGDFLTVGILGTIWTASGGFASLIDALNVSYDVPETRPFWRTRLLAIGLMLVIGTLMIVGVISMFVGPQFGGWLASKLGMSRGFAIVWPTVRWLVSIAFILLAVELIFYWAPNVKQHFLATLPGAAIGVGFWVVTSYGLSIYFQDFANFNKTYGTLGAAIALMVWLYWSWFVILIGAEINSELLKSHSQGRLEIKHPPPHIIHARPAWEEEKEQKEHKKPDQKDQAA